MIRGFALLLICQLAGETFAQATGLLVPGPVIGLVLLVCGYFVYARATGADSGKIEDTDLGRVSTALLSILGLLFVPAGVGIVNQASFLRVHGLEIFVILLVSAVITILVAAGAFLAVKRFMTRKSGAAS